VAAGGSVTLTGTFNDPGVLDSQTLFIAWGDSSKSVSIAIPAGASGFTVMHVFAATSTYTISAQLRDKDGAVSATFTTKAIIGTPGTVVLPITPTPILIGGVTPIKIGQAPSAGVALSPMTITGIMPVTVPSSSGKTSQAGLTALAMSDHASAHMFALVRPAQHTAPPVAITHSPVPHAPAPMLFDETTGEFAGTSPWLDLGIVDDMGDEWAVLAA